MKILILDTTDPAFNLAAEEYLLYHTDEEFFMLWRNDRSVIIGKNQNALAEINRDFVEKNNISVVRRLTGGGAVFHDLGNVNFTFIIKDGQKFADYSFFTAPIIALLAKLGVTATLSGRNDMLIEGKKFSGNAQCCYKGRVLHHGTIMLGADISALSGALNVDPDKILSKGIKSVKSRVTNINEHLASPLSPEEFIELLTNEMLKNSDNRLFELDSKQVAQIQKIKAEKYDTWEWNFGFRRDYTLKNKKRFEFGSIEVQILLQNDRIADIKFFGDYFSKKDVGDVENALIGAPFQPKSIKGILNTLDIDDYFSNITADELLSVIF